MLVALDLVEDHAAELVLRAVELERVSVRHRWESGVTGELSLVEDIWSWG